MDAILNAAIAHLAAFRASWNADDHIDEVSGLTARDVDLILATLGYPDDELEKQSNPVMREIR